MSFALPRVSHACHVYSVAGNCPTVLCRVSGKESPAGPCFCARATATPVMKVKEGKRVASNCYTAAVSPHCELQPMPTGAGDKQVSCSRNTDVERVSERKTLVTEKEKRLGQWKLVETMLQLGPQETLSCCWG